MKKRRYAKGRFEAYDDARERFHAESQVLNPDANWGGTIINLTDAHDVDFALHERTDDDGLLAAAEKAVEWVKTRFKAHQEKRVASGRRKPEEMPSNLQNDLHEAQAGLDVIRDEISRLEELAEALATGEKQKDDSKVLANGPRGVSRMMGGEICELDGQIVGKNEHGMFEVIDDRSRYNGVIVADYFDEIVKPWILANTKLQRAYTKALSAGEFKASEKSVPRAPWPEKPGMEAAANG